MKRDYSPEVYNYNKYPGQQFVAFENQVKSDETILTILENTAETFDAVAFTQRFSEILLKYDYIVGDWGNEQLRLKGFYKDEQKKPSYTKISHVQDYLTEYCNFGCDYFILENPDPREVAFEEEKVARPSKRRKNNRRSSQRAREREEFASAEKSFKKRSRKLASRRERRRSDDSGKKGHFTIRQKS